MSLGQLPIGVSATDITKADRRTYLNAGPKDAEEYDHDNGSAAYLSGRKAIELAPIAREADGLIVNLIP
jgi:hypothetical protein